MKVTEAINIKRRKGASQTPAGDLVQIMGSGRSAVASWTLYEVVLAVVLSIGCWSTYFSMFPDPVGHVYTTIAIIVLPIALYFVSRIKLIGRYLVFYVFLIVAIIWAAGYSFVWNGFLVIANGIVKSLNDLMGLGLLEFHVTGSAGQQTTAAAVALFSVMLLVSAAVAHSVAQKRILLGFFMTAVPVIVGLFLKAEPQLPLLILIALAWIALFVLVNVRGPMLRRRKAPVYVQNEERSMLPIIFIVIVLIIVMIFALIFQIGSYRPAGVVDETRASIVATQERIRYEKWSDVAADSLSKGDLTKTHPLSYTDEVMMTVNVQYPRSFYLRGYVGGFYRASKWNAADDVAFIGENGGVLTLLSQERFYPQLQADRLYRMTGDYATSDIKVHNINDSSKYLYTPYETAMTGDFIPSDIRFDKDENLLARGLFGDRDYTVTMFLPEYGDFAYASIKERLAKAKASPDYAAYAQSEELYRGFVYSTYLDVPPDAAAALGDFITEEDLTRSYDYVLNKIRIKFSEEFIYDQQTKRSRGDDELGSFMGESKTGNDMHFATAATLMLRQADIPARYVEGYYLTPTDVEFYKDSTDVEFNITDSMQHAWVELYVDEAGWIPAEVIPGFYTIDATQLSEEMEDTEDITEIDQEFFEEQTEIDEDDKNAEPPEAKTEPLNLWWLVIVAVVIVIAVIEMLGRRHAKRRLAGFGEQRGEQHVYEIYRYAASLMMYDGKPLAKNPYPASGEIAAAYDEHTNIGFEQLLRAVCAVRFGSIEWTDVEYDDAGDYVRSLATYIYEKQSGLRRFILKYILFRV